MTALPYDLVIRGGTVGTAGDFRPMSPSAARRSSPWGKGSHPEHGKSGATGGSSSCPGGVRHDMLIISTACGGCV
jgi:hypothetical protein